MNHTVVSEEKLEEAWRGVSDAAARDGLSALLEEFSEGQPAMLEFVSEGAEQWSADAADLVFFSVLVLWKCFPQAGTVLAARLAAVFRENMEWLDKQHGEAVLLQKKLSDLSRFREPNLMRYVIEAVFEAHEDGFELEPEEQQQLFIVLKTLVESLSAPS